MIDITPDALEKLDKLSLITYVTIDNSFTGLYMTQQLRRWICRAEMRIGEHRLQFVGNYSDDLSDAILDVYRKVVTYIKANPELQVYWTDDK